MQMSYDETMAWGAAQYSDVVATLSGVGLAAEFTQTGGMCAAVVAPIESGYYLLVTDAEDSLSWDRDAHRGWFVGLYRQDDPADAVRWAQDDEGVTTDDLMVLVREVLHLRAPGD